LLLFPLWRFCSSTEEEEEEDADLDELERDWLSSDEIDEEEDFLCLRYLVLDLP